jgi:WD40 repeat protein
MTTRFTCPKGHEWEIADAEASAAVPVCPVCASLYDTPPPPATAALPPLEDQVPDTIAPAPATEEMVPVTVAPTEEMVPALPTRPPAPAAELTPASMPAAAVELEGVQVPGYQIERELGRGGMGVVYMARQVGLDRLVALKMILAGGHARAAELARFKTEAEAIARLSHPNIVAVYEVGECQGKPFLALEFCGGGSLDRKLAGSPLPAEQAARLVEALAQAMHAAHLANVIHRDLKPANVLLGDDGTPKITDFGLAKKLDEVGQTHTGDVMGTPSYMAPEQAQGKKDIGPAADVYALGAILYELLGGRPPFRAATIYDTLVQVIAEEPVPPRRLNAQVPADLETIVLKCLEKEPARRYASAQELADDLARWQRGEPILARPVSVLERALKWARRRPAIAGLAAFSLVLAVAAFALVTWQWREAVQAQEREAQQRRLAEEAEGAAKQKARDEAAARRAEEQARLEGQRQLYRSNIALAHREWLADNPGRSLELLNECPVHLRGWEWHFLKGLHAGTGLRLRPQGPTLIDAVAFSPDGRHIASASSLSGVVVNDAHTGERVMRLGKKGSPCTSVAYSPDGERLAVGGEDGSVRLWETRTGQTRAVLRDHKGIVYAVAFSPDGRWLASAGQDGQVRLRSPASGKVLATCAGHKEPVRCLAFSHDSRFLASGGDYPDTTVRVWEVQGARSHVTLPSFRIRVTSLAFSPDGSRLAVAAGGRVHLYDPSTGKGLQWLNFSSAQIIYGLAYSPDGHRLAVACRNRQLVVYDFRTLASTIYRGHSSGVTCVTFSQDGARLASGSDVGEVHVRDSHPHPDGRAVPLPVVPRWLAFSPNGRLLAWAGTKGVGLVDVTTGKQVRALPGERSTLEGLAFSPDGRRLAALWKDRRITVWETASTREPLRLRGAARVRSDEGWARPQLAFSGDGKEVLLGDDFVQAWDARTGQELRHRPLDGVAGTLWTSAFSPGAEHFVTVTRDGAVQFWAPATGRPVARFAGPRFPGPLAFSRSGTLLAVASGLRGGIRLVLYDVASRTEVRSFAGHADYVTWLAFSPDGTRLASGSADNTVKLWDVATGTQLLSLEGHVERVNAGAFSPDGRTLATADHGEVVRLWDGGRGREVFTLRGGVALGLAFSPDGKYLAATAGSGDRTLLWDPASGQQRFSLSQPGEQRSGWSLAFSPDSKSLAIGQLAGPGKAAEIDVWDLTSRTRRHRLRGHTHLIAALSCSPDGRRLAAAAWDRTATVWDTSTGGRLTTFRGHTAGVQGVAFHPDGKHVASTGGGWVSVWDADTGVERLRFQAPQGAPGTLLHTPDLWSLLPNLRGNFATLAAIAYSPDGKFLAGAGMSEMPANNAVIVWDANSGRQVRTMRGHKGYLYQVAYRPDGKVLASAGADRSVRLWDASTGKELLRLTGHEERVYRMAFSPDGKRLASTSSDGSVRVWDVADVGAAK